MTHRSVSFLLFVAIPLSLLVVGCAHDVPPLPQSSTQPPMATKIVVRTIEKPAAAKAVCPTRDEIADGIIVASRAVYASSTGSSRTCACPGDTFTNRTRVVICGSPEAGAVGRPAKWGYCRREQVPDDLVMTVAAAFSACRQ
jgi:hypothetical protein